MKSGIEIKIIQWNHLIMLFLIFTGEANVPQIEEWLSTILKENDEVGQNAKLTPICIISLLKYFFYFLI